MITPNESFDRTSHQWLSGFIFAISTVFEAIYIALGLWVVGLFLFLAASGLIGMLSLFRRGLNRQEVVKIADGQVRITRYRRDACVAETTFSPQALSIECDRDPDYGLQRILLRQRDRSVEIARDLSPAERATFLEALKRAMARHGLRPQVRTRLAASGA